MELQVDLSEICLEKKLANGLLILADGSENQRFSHYKAITENCFLRSCRYSLLSYKWRWSEESYKKYFRIWVLFIDEQILFNLLRVSAETMDLAIHGCLYYICETTRKKRLPLVALVECQEMAISHFNRQVKNHPFLSVTSSSDSIEDIKCRWTIQIQSLVGFAFCDFFVFCSNWFSFVLY